MPEIDIFEGENYVYVNLPVKNSATAFRNVLSFIHLLLFFSRAAAITVTWEWHRSFARQYFYHTSSRSALSIQLHSWYIVQPWRVIEFDLLSRCASTEKLNANNRDACVLWAPGLNIFDAMILFATCVLYLGTCIGHRTCSMMKTLP